MNRSGQTESDRLGSATAGFTSFTFSDTGNAGIHGARGSAGSPLTGNYKPDGSTLGNFFTEDPNGEGKVFFADLAGGGGSSQSLLVNWQVTLTAGPEPVDVALGIFAGLGLAVGAWRTRFWQRANRI